MKPTITLFLLITVLQTNAQTDTIWSLLLLKKGKEIKLKEKPFLVNDNGFYLFRNCIYDIELANKVRYKAKLIKIKKDSLFFQNSFNEKVATTENLKFDTLKISVDNFRKIILLRDRILGVSSKLTLSNYNFIFKQDTSYWGFPKLREKRYRNDTITCEVVPYITGYGFDYLFEENGKVYYYEGPILKPQTPKSDTTHLKRSVGLFPSFSKNIDEVKVFTLDFMLIPSENKKQLTVKGACVELNPLGVFFSVLGGFLIKDSLLYNRDAEKTTVHQKGFGVSLGGFIGDTELNGLTISGAFTAVNTIKGVSLSGVHIYTQELNGISIAGVRNLAKKGRGVQIALFNSSKNFKGLQFGLWNKNSKRSLPFINWQFKA